MELEIVGCFSWFYLSLSLCINLSLFFPLMSASFLLIVFHSYTHAHSPFFFFPAFRRPSQLFVTLLPSTLSCSVSVVKSTPHVDAPAGIMGTQSSKMNGTFYLTGPQDFTYDEKFPLFEKQNGLLFRLVNNDQKQWAFYSDSKKYEFHVTVNFGAKSRNLVALGNTYLAEDPDGGWIAKTIVYPGKTEPFIQGEVVGFDSVVNAVLLTTEYKERRKEEKKAQKKAEKEALSGQQDELGSNAN